MRGVSKRYYLRQIVACVLSCWMLLGMPMSAVLANPNPNNNALPYGIMSGSSSGVTTNTAGQTMNIGSNVGQTVIKWRNFDIGEDRTVNFLQGGGWVLNQVYASDYMATGIHGKLNAANCGIIVTNPRGIVFGPKALVNAKNFTASGLRMDIDKFKDTKFEFDSSFASGSGVVTVGAGAQINAQETVALIGKKVFNMGTIQAGSGGAVVMNAADKVVISTAGGKINVTPTISGDAKDYVVDNGGSNGTGTGIINASGAEVVLAAGDIYSTAIKDAESLTAKSHTNIRINGELSATGDITLWADYNGDTHGNMHAGYDDSTKTSFNVPITAGGNIEIRGNEVRLGGPVAALNGNLTITGRDCLPSEPEVKWFDVWAYDTLYAKGNIEISATGEERVITGYHYGRPIYGTVYKPGTIHLFGDVTADADIKLFNNTYTYNTTDNGVTLLAGNNIELLNSGDPYENATFLHGQHYLALRAGNEILAPMSTEIGVWGSTLVMQQDPTLNLANFNLANQSDTDLTLISTGESVVATTGENAANNWKSIGAHAKENITLGTDFDDSNLEITLGDSGTNGKSLWAEDGYIEIDGFNVKNSDDFADWDLEAGTTLSVSVEHGINLGGDVTSGGDMELISDNDKRYGHDTVVAGNINSGGTLLIEGSNIDIHSAHSQSDMDIYAHGLYGTENEPDEPLIGSGDVRVGGTLTTTDGHIQITATEVAGGATTGPGFSQGSAGVPYDATGTIYLADDVTANSGDGDDVLLNSNTVALNSIKIESTGDDVVLLEGKTLRGEGSLVIKAADDIKLGGHDATETGAPGETSTYGNLTLDAGDDIFAFGDLSSDTGDIETFSSDTTTNLYGDVTAYDGSIIFHNSVSALGSGTQTFSAQGSGSKLQAMGSVAKPMSGNLILSGGSDLDYEVQLGGDVTVSGGGNLFVGTGSDDTTVAAGKTLKSTGGDVKVSDRLNGQGDLNIWAADDITIGGDATVDGHFVAQAGQVSGRESTLSTRSVTAGSMVLESGNRSVDGTKRDNVNVAYGENLETTNGDLVVIADDHIYLGGDVTSAGDAKILANQDSGNGGIVGNVKVEGNILADNVEVEGRNVTLDGNVEAYGSATTTGTIDITADDKAMNGSDGDVTVGGTLAAYGDITVEATDDITLQGGLFDGYDASALTFGDISLLANRGGYSGAYGGNLSVAHDVISLGGDVTMDASADTIFLGGDVFAFDDVWLMTNTKFNGSGHQNVQAVNGGIRADGFVRKVTSGDLTLRSGGTNDDGLGIDLRYDGYGPGVSTYSGNIWIIGLGGDVQISDDVTTFGPGLCTWGHCPCSGWETGGVMIASAGKIYTEGYDDALNVNIWGNSDHYKQLGVYDRFGFLGSGTFGPEDNVGPMYAEQVELPRLAIAIVSNEELKLGPDGSLNAFGTYYEPELIDESFYSPDDRGMFRFLAADNTEIGGHVRNEGDAFDAAIYTASFTSGVTVDMPVQIKSRETVGDLILFSVNNNEQQYRCVPRGAMIVDAYDVVTLGDNFKSSLADRQVGDRLEVASRITEWLDDAVGRLPFPEDLPLPEGYKYVMRGAGLENPIITDGRAWVLEDKGDDNPPLTLAPLFREEVLDQSGCPALMQWFASEVELPKDQINVILNNADYLATDIQPCDSCARLKHQADTMARMDQGQIDVWANTVMTGMAGPISPEMMDGIRTALAGNPAALSFDDAATEYVRVLNEELGFDRESAVALLTSKYTPNQAELEAYINARVGM